MLDGVPAPPGVRRRLRVAVGGHHHEPVVQPVGRGVPGRPDGRGGDRPDRQPREACPVPGRVLPRAKCVHVGGMVAQKGARDRCANC